MGRAVIPLFGYSVFPLMLAACGDGKDSSSNPHDKPHNPGQAVEVRSVSPVSGGIGTKVIVAGSNFGNDTTGVQLYFNQKKALIMNIQDNAIYALVPRQPGDFSTIRVVIKGREAVLDGMRFQYFIRSNVTTVSGQYMVSRIEDGPALQATFGRPVITCTKKDGSLVFISDDNNANGSGRLRLYSTQDGIVTTLLDGLYRPWMMAFNTTEDRLFVCERDPGSRPILFHAVAQNTNWVQRDTYYDQTDDEGHYIAGSMTYAGLTADDTYVYMMSNEKLIRVHQITKKVEAISGGSLLPGYIWQYPVFSKIDKKIYFVASSAGRLFRFDPYHTPEGRTTPWLTASDVEHIAGMSSGTAKEGNGFDLRIGGIEPIGIDRDGNVILPDVSNSVIWKIDPELNGTIIAGVVGSAGYRDGNPREAQFNYAFGVSTTDNGQIYIADSRNFLIRCITIQ